MENIDPVRNSLFNPQPQKKAEKKGKARGAQARPFASLLETEQESGLTTWEEDYNDKSLEELLDNVHRSGEVLKDYTTLENVKKFKQSVQSFLRYVMDKMLTIEEKTSGVNILKRKKYVLIRVTDKKLESLVTAVLKGQRDQLEILRRIDEINGLLVDILS